MNKKGDDNLKTPLYEIHKENNAFMQNYFGFEMPIYYSSIYDEHLAVRNSVGMFDISHMGNIIVSGIDLNSFLDLVIPNELRVGKITYSMFLDEEGKIIDDFMIYPLSLNKVMFVVNASNTTKCYNWLLKNKVGFNIEIDNISNEVAAIAVQGPKSKEILNDLILELPKKLGDYIIFDNNTIVSRSGYTKELGYEIYGDSNYIINLVQSLINKGIVLCGLGSRDTLRFEAGLGLYGNELTNDTTPYEADLSFILNSNKHDFIGKKFLSRYKPTKKLIRLILDSRQAARNGYEIQNKNGDVIGKITSGYLLPNYNNSHAFALIDEKEAFIDNIVYVVLRNKLVEATIINKELLKKENK